MLSPGKQTFIAGETILAGARVKFGANVQTVVLAGETDVEIGTAEFYSGKSSYASGTPVGIVPLTHNGTRTCLAAGAFAAGASVKRMAGGKVDDTGAGAVFGIAMEAATADGDQVEVLYQARIA